MFSLGRKIDINYPTNKIIIIISLLIGVIGSIMTGEIQSGIYLALGTFLSWALAREVDPGHEKSAFVAVGLSVVNLFYYERIEVLVLVWLMLTMRMISRITGKELQPLDFVVLFGMSLYLSVNNQNTIYILIFLVNMAILILLKEKIKLATAASILAISSFYIVENFYFPSLSLNRLDSSRSINMFAINLVSLSFFYWTYMSKDRVRDDQGDPVDRSRISWSQIIYNLSFLLIFFLGDMTINNLIIYLAVTGGVMIYSLGSNFIGRGA